MASETALLQALISAATGQPGAPGWCELLRLLATTTRAETVALRFEVQGRSCGAWHHGSPPPLLEETEKMRLGRVYAQGDLPGLLSRRAPLRAIRCPAGPRGSALLQLHRPAEAAEDFRALDGVQLSALAPYLGPALTGWQQVRDERRRAARDSALARDLGAAWILFSAGGQVLERSAGCDLLLAEAGLRVTGDGRLVATGTGHPEDLLPRLRMALPRSAPDQPVETLVLTPQPRLEMRIGDLADGTRLARLRCAPQAAELSVGRLARHLGLAPSEAQLAQLICDGRSLAEAAGMLGWTLETTRSTSKQIFARMGVRGQAGVIRQIQAGAVWLGQRQEGQRQEDESGP